MTLYLALLIMWWAEVCSFRSSSLMRRVISDLALATASSWELSMARYSFLSPSGGFLPGGTYVPRTVIPASLYSLISASASWNKGNRDYESAESNKLGFWWLRDFTQRLEIDNHKQCLASFTLSDFTRLYCFILYITYFYCVKYSLYNIIWNRWQWDKSYVIIRQF